MIALSRRPHLYPASNAALLRRRSRRLLGLLHLENVQLSILLTGDDEIRQLNSEYRNLDKSTDVLSFPQDLPSAITQARVLGDVVLSVETAARQAARGPLSRIARRLEAYGPRGVSAMNAWDINAELLFLLLHGVLHLLGFDHEAEPEAEAMESAEADLLPVLIGVDRRRNLRFNLDSLVMEHNGGKAHLLGEGVV